jgi:plastocyanin domain-containing protein
MRQARILGVVLILLLSSLGAAQESTGRRVVAAVGPDGVQKVEITGASYYFDPNGIVVKVNVPVQLIIKKVGKTSHNISLKAPEAGIDFKISLRTEPQIIEFTPTKVGKYPFWCTKKFLFFKSHKEHGMQGLLEVVE